MNKRDTVEGYLHGSYFQLVTLSNLLQADTENVISVYTHIESKKDGSGKMFFKLELKPAEEGFKNVRRERKPIDRRGYVYLLETNEPGLYKIGKTKDPKDRKHTFNVKLPYLSKYLKLIPCSNRSQYETWLKGEMADYMVKDPMGGKTEFFKLPQGKVDWICSLDGD